MTREIQPDRPPAPHSNHPSSRIGKALRWEQGMDSIQIRGIRAYGYTGYLPEENVLGQWFEVDLTLWTPLEKAGISDDIADTVDYREAIA